VKVLVTACLSLLEDTDQMKFAVCMAVSFITFFHIPLVPLFFIIVYMVICYVCFCL